ncbi:MAG: phage tail family protein [Eubacteriales bacterium]|nr:phage tail family protein [Eubacteriales bacterium]
MLLQYFNDSGEMLTFANATPPAPDILLTAADGLYGYENTVYTSTQNGQDGSRYEGSNLSPRRIGLTLKLYNDVVAVRKTIMRTASPKTLGTLRITRGSVLRDIRCIVEKVDTNAQDGSIMNLYLLCPNPYWREESESRINIATWEPLFSYPLTIEQGVGFMFGQRTEKRVINVRNEGTAGAGMRIVFTASSDVENPRISNAMARTQYMLAKTMLHAGDILTMQTGKGEKKATIYRADGGIESNAYGLLDIANITFLQLAPGDNYLSYSADSGENYLTVAVFYYSSYLEV